MPKNKRNNPALSTPLPPLRARPVGSELAWSCTSAYFCLLVLGVIVLRLPGAFISGNEMSFPRAVFTVADAGTLTGFQQSRAIDEYKLQGQVMMLALVIGGSLFSLIVGGTAVTRIARLRYRDLQIAIGAIVAELCAIGIGVLTLHREGQSAFATVLQAASAFGNCGAWMGATPTALDSRLHLILLPLAWLGGLGVPVLMDLLDAARGKSRLSRHTAGVLVSLAIVYFLGFLACFYLLYPSDASADEKWPAIRGAIASASLLSINARSAGIPTGFVNEFPRAVQSILMLLMLIGAAPGGTAGGLKTTTIARLLGGVRRIFRNESPGKSFGIAIVFVIALFSLILSCHLWLLDAAPELSADRVLFLSISAACNVGLSHDRVSLIGDAFYVVSATMLLGRILPCVVLWWIALTCDDSDVAIG